MAFYTRTLTWIRVILAAVAGLAFLAAMLEPLPEVKPTELLCTPLEGASGQLTCTPPSRAATGFYGAIIAVVVGVLGLTMQYTQTARGRRVVDALVGVSILASGYLLLAAEAETHPKDPTLPLGLLLLFAATAMLVLLVAMPWLLGRLDNRDAKGGGE